MLMPSEDKKREALNRVASRLLEHSKGTITHEQAKKIVVSHINRAAQKRGQ